MGREEREKQQMMAEAEAAGVGVIDARGRTLREGDEIILSVKGPVFYRVVGIRPNLDPRAPKDQLYIDVGVVIPFLCQRGVVNKEFILVRTVEEAGPSNLQVTDVVAPPGKGLVQP